MRRERAALTDSGISGCDVRFAFFAPTARRLAARWPRELEIDWQALESGDALEAWLPLLAHEGEVPGLDEVDYGLREPHHRADWFTRQAAWFDRWVR